MALKNCKKILLEVDFKNAAEFRAVELGIFNRTYWGFPPSLVATKDSSKSEGRQVILIAAVAE